MIIKSTESDKNRLKRGRYVYVGAFAGGELLLVPGTALSDDSMVLVTTAATWWSASAALKWPSTIYVDDEAAVIPVFDVEHQALPPAPAPPFASIQFTDEEWCHNAAQDDDDGTSSILWIPPLPPLRFVAVQSTDEDLVNNAARDDDGGVTPMMASRPAQATPVVVDEEAAVIPVLDQEVIAPPLTAWAVSPRTIYADDEYAAMRVDDDGAVAMPLPAWVAPLRVVSVDEEAAVVPVFDHDGPYVPLQAVTPMSFAPVSSVDEEREPAAVVINGLDDGPDPFGVPRMVVEWRFTAYADEEWSQPAASVQPSGTPAPLPIIPLGRLRAIVASFGELRADIDASGELCAHVDASGEICAHVDASGGLRADIEASDELLSSIAVVGDLDGTLS